MTLALKYRPSSFEFLIGQESVSQTLSLALDKNKIGNAYLFSGLRGSGKTSSARIFARALECDNGPTSKPCGVCSNCQASLSNSHMDIIEMDGASSRGIDDIRNIIEQTKYGPSYGRFKIFIIDEVHMLTKEAFNALLKTLEEPPEYIKFILATTDPLKLPATILSRTQHFRFKKIPHKSVVEHLGNILLKEGIEYEDEALDILARSGSGSLRDTLTLLEQAIVFGNGKVSSSEVTKMLGIIDPDILDNFFKSLFAKDESSNDEFFSLILEYECEMILDEMIFFLKEKLLLRDLKYSTVFVDRFLRILVDAKELLEINCDGEFVLVLSRLKMYEALKMKDIDALIENLSTQMPSINPANPTNSVPSPAIVPTPVSIPSSIGVEIPKNNDFATLIAKIYDRDYSLGECFEKNISFIEFGDGVLSLQSSAMDADRETLRKCYSVIKNLVSEVYGVSVSLNVKSVEVTNNANEEVLAQPISDSQSQESSPQEVQPQETQSNIESEPNEQTDSLDPHKVFFEKNKDLIGVIKKNINATSYSILKK